MLVFGHPDWLAAALAEGWIMHNFFVHGKGYPGIKKIGIPGSVLLNVTVPNWGPLGVSKPCGG